MSASAIEPLNDFDAVARSALSACPGLLHEWFPAGKVKGREFCVGNLRGDRGDSLSINLDTGQWADFASADQKGGDLISLYAALNKLSQWQAARELSAKLGVGRKTAASVIPISRSTEGWHPILPVPANAPPPPRAHFQYGEPTHVAEVRDVQGVLLHLIYRFEPRGGRKQIWPLTYGTNRGKHGWHWKAPLVPRPLYGLPSLAAYPDAPVLLVEGEAKRDAAARMLGQRAAVLSWPNGAGGTGNADWSPLQARGVAIWPDADANGTKAASAVAKALKVIASTVSIVPIPDGKAEGWDLADAEREGWTGQDVLDRIGTPLKTGSAGSKAYTEKEGAGSRATEAAEPYAAAEPFQILGHDRSTYFFLAGGGGQVVELKAKDLSSPGCLLQVAPLEYWEANFPSNKEGFRAAAAANYLMRQCELAGIYDPTRVRGRGAWFDGGKAVLHLGDKLIVDGKAVSLHALGDGNIYERARTLDVPLGEPLDDEEAARLTDLCSSILWADQLRSGLLFSGFLVIAPVCGALPWRPHGWISAEHGAGKSWVIENLAKPVFGPIALDVQGKSSDAGIRGELGRDARPVVFEEAETQSIADRARIQGVIDLSRQASTEGGSDIVKGTAGGGSRRYSVRSCFLFSSINDGLSQAADESRTVKFTLNLPPDDPIEREEHFSRVSDLHAEVMTPDFPARLLARTLRLLPVIRRNAETFATVIARSGRTRRSGDTYGVLLAGAWSLRSGHKVTPK